MTIIDELYALPGHDLLLDIPHSFLKDEFNVAGLSERSDLEEIGESLNAIWEALSDDDLGGDGGDGDDNNDFFDENAMLTANIRNLYYVLHQRYALSKAGLHDIGKLWEQAVFGRCRRHHCQGCALLPCGESSLAGRGLLRGLCPKCRELYCLNGRRKVDGACYGSSVAGMLMLTHAGIKAIAKQYTSNAVYEPRIFGFRLTSSKQL